MFSEYEDVLVRIHWLIHNILEWVPLWLTHVGTMCRDEWLALDLELKKLFVVLEYEHPSLWHGKVLCNPPYTPWVAKLVVFAMRNADRDPLSRRMPFETIFM